MRIISKFHDYYDGVAAYDQDRSLIYNRQQHTFSYRLPFNLENMSDQKELPLPKCKEVTYGYNDWRMYINQVIVGFCGKIYPVLQCDKSFPCWAKDNTPSFKFDCRNIDDFDLFVEKNFGYDKDFMRQKYTNKKSHFRKNISDFFNEVSQKQDDFEDLFLDAESPLFVSRYNHRFSDITFNDSLKSYIVDFPSVYPQFDAYTAYQEISMFLGGMAVPQTPIPPIGDEVMAEIKGFDKYSFRKNKQSVSSRSGL